MGVPTTTVPSTTVPPTTVPPTTVPPTTTTQNTTILPITTTVPTTQTTTKAPTTTAEPYPTSKKQLWSFNSKTRKIINKNGPWQYQNNNWTDIPSIGKPGLIKETSGNVLTLDIIG